jgi:signal transduction histidine kinase
VRNLRLIVVALAIGLAVPVVLLVHRAVRSVALERELRHRTVAERVFDEMERTLSDFLRVEEGRPVEGWAATAPATPFTLGYFEIAPDGGITVNGLGGADGPARRALLEGVAERWRAGDAGSRANESAQLPGTTVGLVRQSRAAAPAAPAGQDEREVSAYAALSALNKAASERAEQQKVKSAGSGAREKDLADRLERRDADRNRPSADGLAAAIAVPPFIGRALDGERLVLSRTVVRSGQAHRQGVVLDVARLGPFLHAQALGDDVLATHASLTLGTSAAAGPPPRADFVYQHRFADPFDDLSARIALRALPGSGDARYVYALSGALFAVAVLGLVALYRLVSVRLAFAERRSNFVAAVSHELKTPLTAIRMYGEMLRDGIVSSDAKRQDYYRHITAESERLSRLINNVLEFSRLEKGVRDVALTTEPLAPVVREAAELVRPHVEAEGFALRLEVADALPPVRFERDALLQVLFNLVDNAVKYARDGAERSITICAVPHDGGVRLAVRDSGSGVPERHLAHVFEPFYRGEHELTRRHRGTGLGLALVRGLVDRMGGRVEGRNAPGGGFEVTVALPAATPTG